MSFLDRSAAYWASDLIQRAAPPIISRAVALTTNVLALVTTISVMDGDQRLDYAKVWGGTVLNPALVTGDGAQWVPAGQITPNHFVANETPGTTNIAPGVVSALAFFRETRAAVGADRQPAAAIDFLPQAYRFDSRVSIPSSYQNVTLRGNGAFVTGTLTTAFLRIGDDSVFDSADCAGSSTTYSSEVTGFIFRNTNTTAVGSKAIELGKAWNGRIHGNQFWDFDIAIDAVATGHSNVYFNFFFVRGRGTVDTTAFIRARGVYDSSLTKSPGAGLFLRNNDLSGHPTQPDRVLNGIIVHTCDTVYWGGNHISFCRNSLTLDPQGSAGNYANNDISDIISEGNNYLDDAGSGAQILITGTVAYDDVPSNPSRARGFIGRIILSTSDKLRGASNALHGVHMLVTDGSIVPGDYLANRGKISITTGGEFAQHKASHINLQGPATGYIPASHTLLGLTSWDTLTDPTRTVSILSQQGGTAIISGVRVLKERNPPVQLFQFNFASDTGARGVLINGVNAIDSTYTGNDPISVQNATGAFVSVKGVVERAIAGWERDALNGHAMVVGATSVVARTWDLPATQITCEFAFTAVLDSTDVGVGDRFAAIAETLTVRRDGGVSTVPAGGHVNVKTILSTGWGNTTYPATFVLMTGAPWPSTTAVTEREVRTSAGGAYVCLKSGTTGVTAPTDTSGALIDDGTARWAYLGPTNANRLAMIFAGQSGFDLRCRGKAELKVGV